MEDALYRKTKVISRICAGILILSMAAYFIIVFSSLEVTTKELVLALGVVMLIDSLALIIMLNKYVKQAVKFAKERRDTGYILAFLSIILICLALFCQF